uniref:Nucleotide-diphospho-sugar transferase domain-containing protein n=1 Tax=viral metagenome TaxID=1070528 RepID=A0A6C0ERT4_9ZZZZ
MNNIIFGVYNGYDSLKTANGGIYYFMKSLRKHNPDCKVVIICEKHNIFNELELFSKEMNFEIFTDFNVKYSMMYYRFEIYRNYLNHLNEQNIKFDKILLSDINDVIFQEDPFSILFTEELYCALEHNTFCQDTYSSNLNMYWAQESNHLSENNYESYKHNNVVCAGTILGSYLGIVKYLDFYKNTQDGKIVNDQGLLNVYVYNYLSSKKLLPYKESKILTLDGLLFDSLNIDTNKNVLNSNNEKYSIIHQINRCNLPFMLSLVE